MISWKRGRNGVWDVTVVNTFATSYISTTEVDAGSASERAPQLTIAKYDEIVRNHIFVPPTCEVIDVWRSEAVEFMYL